MAIRDLFRRFVTALYAEPTRRPARVEPARAEPGEVTSFGWRRTVPAFVLAVLLPLAVGVALIPLRDRLDQSVSLVMLLPVLVAAVLGGAAPGIVGALSAGLVFDVLHTEPYYRFTIDDTDDVVEMVVLLLVGIAAGLITEHARRSVSASLIRRHELEVLTAFIRDSTGLASTAEIIEVARRSIQSLLSLRACEWRLGYHGTVGAVLQSDGTLSRQGVPALRIGSTETAALPAVVELPLRSSLGEIGRFVLHGSPRPISIEERRAAAAIASLVESRLWAATLDESSGGEAER